MVVLSYGQERLWFNNQLDPASGAYNVPLEVRIRGPLDVQAMRGALADVMERHEVLRTVYPSTDEGPVPKVLVGAEVAPDLTALDCPLGDLHGQVRQASSRSFNLATHCPLRAYLFRIEPRHHVLLLVIHHIATDGGSTPLLCRELSEAYAARSRGEVPELATLPVQYQDYAVWQRELLGDENDPESLLSRQLTFWRSTLSGLPNDLPLPSDSRRPCRPSHRGIVVTDSISSSQHKSLRSLASQEGATLFMVLQALSSGLLTQIGAGTDLPIGSPVAGRNDEELEDLIGFFVNTLVFRVDTSADPSLRDLIQRVRQTNLEAMGNQDVPFERLVEHLKVPRSLARHPLFQVMLVLQSSEPEDIQLTGCQTRTRLLTTETAKFDLGFDFTESFSDAGEPGGIVIRLVFATDLFQPDSATLLAQRFMGFLGAWLQSPDKPLSAVPIVDPEERHQLLVEWNGRAGKGQPQTIDELFKKRARDTPGAIALVCETQSVAYGELSDRADRMAGALRSRGVGPGHLLPILLERGVDLVVAVLATLRAKAAYTLLDPDFPDKRLCGVARRCSAPLSLTRRSLAARLFESDLPALCLEEIDTIAGTGEQPATMIGPEALASVMFTSGSTGEPKGVMVPHRAVTGTFCDQGYAQFGTDETFLQCSPVSWDAFALELFGSLMFGGTCVIPPGQKPEPGALVELVSKHGVTMLQVSASLFNFLVDEHPQIFQQVRLVFTGGEAASVPHVARALTQFPNLRVSNGYGPAESMGFTTVHSVSGDDLSGETIPIGRPVNNKTAYLLDSRMLLVPVGVVGDLYLGGDGLAQGYLGDGGATAARFVANPFGPPGSRLYRTGDLARWRPDGVLEFRGRSDVQVKIRGFRVEPAEVVSVLLTEPSIRQAVVVPTANSEDHLQLIAYLVGDQVDVHALRDIAADKLPEYLVPSAFVILDRLPLTPNGKLDVSALPTPTYESKLGSRAPQTEREKQLCALFCDILGLADVGIDDSFFDLGGHSLLAARLSNRVRSTLGLDLELSAVFRNPTVADLAVRLDSAPSAVSRPKLRRMT